MTPDTVARQIVEIQRRLRAEREPRRTPTNLRPGTVSTVAAQTPLPKIESTTENANQVSENHGA